MISDGCNKTKKKKKKKKTEINKNQIHNEKSVGAIHAQIYVYTNI